MKPKKLLLKACVKCGGDLALVNGLDGWEWNCIQCSKNYPPSDERIVNLLSK